MPDSFCSPPAAIPKGWTVDQVEAVLNLLVALENAVFYAYEDSLTERALLDATDSHFDATNVDNDPIPF